MKRELSEWADLLYNPDHEPLAHIVPFGQPYSLCGARPLSVNGWWGSGDMDEIELAHAMDRCPQCLTHLS